MRNGYEKAALKNDLTKTEIEKPSEALCDVHEINLTLKISNMGFERRRYEEDGSLERKCLRKVTRIYYPQRIGNEELVRRTRVRSIRDEIVKRFHSYLGHALRHNPQTTELLLTSDIRQRGRPKINLENKIRRRLSDGGFTITEVPQGRRSPADTQKSRRYTKVPQGGEGNLFLKLIMIYSFQFTHLELN